MWTSLRYPGGSFSPRSLGNHHFAAKIVEGAAVLEVTSSNPQLIFCNFSFGLKMTEGILRLSIGSAGVGRPPNYFQFMAAK